MKTTKTAIHPRASLTVRETAARRRSFADDVREGLLGSPKSLPCVYLYDERGSALFDRICDLDEYYPTRTERRILTDHVGAILAHAPPGASLVELGSGRGAKTRVIIDALAERDGLVRYVPIDVSRDALEASVLGLVRRHDTLEIDGRVGEYEFGLATLPDAEARLVIWLGSSVGNFDIPNAVAFLRGAVAELNPADLFLIGIDLQKDAAVLEAAYDDAEGVTAAFNFNVLERINRELGGSFDLGRFGHRAIYRPGPGRVEMHLVSEVEQTVQIAALDLAVPFAAGETIHTESAYKYTLEGIDRLASLAGLRVVERWLDDDRAFSVNLLASAER